MADHEGTDTGDDDAPHAELPRILVVDDNDVVREVLHEFLGVLYHIDGAATAAEALHVIAEQIPDLILLDLQLPGTDGMTLLRSLRDKGITTPVVVITGYGSLFAADQAAEFGVAAYLDKPFDLRKLERLVADIIHRRGSHTR